MTLKNIFIDLVKRYSDDEAFCNELWNIIEKKHSSKKRYYHNLSHLEALVRQLDNCHSLIKDRDTVLFAVFYHDIIYNVLKSNNEEQSTAVAVKYLKQTRFPSQKIENCKAMILATRSHEISQDNDINLFTDADLSILGQPKEVYKQYCLDIRKEYGIYPDIIYKPGRKKVAEHFLQMERIFKTDVFFHLYEDKARENLRWEIINLK